MRISLPSDAENGLANQRDALAVVLQVAGINRPVVHVIRHIREPWCGSIGNRVVRLSTQLHHRGGKKGIETGAVRDESQSRPGLAQIWREAQRHFAMEGKQMRLSFWKNADGNSVSRKLEWSLLCLQCSIPCQRYAEHQQAEQQNGRKMQTREAFSKFAVIGLAEQLTSVPGARARPVFDVARTLCLRALPGMCEVIHVNVTLVTQVGSHAHV